jgi:dihydroneopterin aldolase
MPDQLVIKGLEFQGHIGITPDERRDAQPIGVDLELDYPDDALVNASIADDISRAVDYARVADRVTEVGQSQEFSLLETLADRLANVLFAEFTISAVRLWVRKLVPPVNNVRGSVGVRLERHRPYLSAGLREPSLQLFTEALPAPFMVNHLSALRKGLALDVAAGRGRNALYLAAQGFTVEAVDWDQQGLASMEEAAQERRLSNLTVRCTDLEATPTFPKEQYDTIIVFFYLQRNLFPALFSALKTGGILMYETFLIDNHFRRMHPRRREFCLGHNELLRLTSELRTLHYEEGEHEGAHGTEQAFTARLIASKE